MLFPLLLLESRAAALKNTYRNPLILDVDTSSCPSH